MKFAKALTALTILMSSAFANATTTEDKVGMWERFCVEKNVGDACRKAVNSLAHKILYSKGYEIEGLQTRLEKVAKNGCKLKDKTSCKQVESAAFQRPTSDQFADIEAIESELE